MSNMLLNVECIYINVWANNKKIKKHSLLNMIFGWVRRRTKEEEQTKSLSVIVNTIGTPCLNKTLIGLLYGLIKQEI